MFRLLRLFLAFDVWVERSEQWAIEARFLICIYFFFFLPCI